MLEGASPDELDRAEPGPRRGRTALRSAPDRAERRPAGRARARPSHFVDSTTVVRVRATPRIRRSRDSVRSRPATSGTRTLIRKLSSPATNQQSSTSSSALQRDRHRVLVGGVGQVDADQGRDRAPEGRPGRPPRGSR